MLASNSSSNTKQNTYNIIGEELGLDSHPNMYKQKVLLLTDVENREFC